MVSGDIVQSFLASALNRGEWSVSLRGPFTSGEGASGTPWIDGLVGPRVGLDTVEKRKYLTLEGNRTLTVQPVVLRYAV
jgi:hypothetical protein